MVATRITRGRIKRSRFFRRFLYDRRLVSALLLIIAACGPSAAVSGPAESPAVVDLSTDNYKRATNGRTVLLLFGERGCAVCREVLDPAWERLAAEQHHDARHGGSGAALVARVDCTHPRGQVVCERFGVAAAPTILYGDPLDPREYVGGYDYGSLSTFAREQLGRPVCHVRYPEACNDSTRALIGELRARPLEDLLAEKQRIDTMMKEHWGTTFSMSVQNAFVTQTERETNYKWIQQILAEDHGQELEESPFVWHEVAMDDDDGLSEDLQEFPDEQGYDDEYFEDADDGFYDEEEYDEDYDEFATDSEHESQEDEL